MVNCPMEGVEGLPRGIEVLEGQGLTVSREACLTGLNDTAIKRVEAYYETFATGKGMDMAKLARVKDFFINGDTLQKVVSLYEGLLSEEDRITAEKQAFLAGHLSFVLERAFDQHVDNPENYVSHGFDHTLNVVRYVDQIMAVYPEVVGIVGSKYEITGPQARFLLENVALFHDFGYPVSEAKKLGKTTHSVVGADVINHGQTEVNGQKVPIKEVLARILNDTSNGRMMSDLRNSIMLHNADKIEQFYDGKITTDKGEFLVKRENVAKGYTTLKELGHKVNSIFVGVDNPEEIKDVQTQLWGKLASLKEVMEMPQIQVGEAEERFKGRSFDSKGRNDILALEYSTAVLMEEPLKAIIRLADNMDITRDRLSDLQTKPLFMAYYYELGDKNSHFYEGNKKVEMVLEEVKKNGRLNDLTRTVAACISAQEVYRQEDDLIKSGTPKDVAAKVVRNKLDQFFGIWAESLQRLDIDECLACWRGFVVDEIALRPGFQQVDEVTKSEIKKVAVKMDSSGLRHFGGCEAVRDVQVTERGIGVTVDQDVYDELNTIIVRDEIKSTTGQTSFTEVGVGKYQIERMTRAFESVGIKSGEPRLLVYVNGEKYENN